MAFDIPKKKHGSFAEKVLAEKNRMYYLRFAPKDSDPTYYFVLIDPPKEQAFLDALNGTEVFNLEDYGKIINSGYGEPSAELKQEMKEKYNIQYDDE